MEELQKGRRNLLIVAGLIIVYQLAGGSLEAINSPAVSIKLQHPEYVVYFVWLMLLYEAVRFNTLIDGDEHGKAFREKFRDIILSKEFIEKIEKSIVLEAEPAGSSSRKLFDRAPTLIELARLERRIFRRKLTYTYFYDGSAHQKNLPVTWPQVFSLETKRDMENICMSDFLEFMLPLYCAWFAVVIQFFLLLKDYVYPTSMRLL